MNWNLAFLLAGIAALHALCLSAIVAIVTSFNPSHSAVYQTALLVAFVSSGLLLGGTLMYLQRVKEAPVERFVRPLLLAAFLAGAPSALTGANPLEPQGTLSFLGPDGRNHEVLLFEGMTQNIIHFRPWICALVLGKEHVNMTCNGNTGQGCRQHIFEGNRTALSGAQGKQTVQWKRLSTEQNPKKVVCRIWEGRLDRPRQVIAAGNFFTRQSAKNAPCTVRFWRENPSPLPYRVPIATLALPSILSSLRRRW